MAKNYVKRIIDIEIDKRIKAFGAIQIVGPKGCGKTRTAKERCNTVISFEDEDKRDSYLSFANNYPSSFLNNKTPILFDEWQDAPKIWGTIKKACDDETHFGSFYLTGSSSKKVDTPHTGTGRISTIEMYPMTLYETGDSNGLISLSDLFDKHININGIQSNLTIEKLLYVCTRGGWPKTLDIEEKNSKLLIAQDYFRQIVNVDISKIDGVKRNPEVARNILKSYARNIGTLCKKSKIYEDVIANYNVSLSTIDTYIDKLKELFVIYDLDSWSPQIRSPKSLRSAQKHLFVDPSIAIAALEVNNNYFYSDFDFFGRIFESLVLRDLTVYSSALDGRLSHYHDAYDLEVDAVLHLKSGKYALIEIKLGANDINKGIKNLKKVVDLIRAHNEIKDSVKIKEPDLLIIITGGNIAQEIEGVKIIPIGCLKD